MSDAQSSKAVYSIVHQAVVSALEVGAPGIAPPVRAAIATNAALKATPRIAALQVAETPPKDAA